MSVIPSNLVYYCAADMVTADGVTTGGAIDITSRVSFADIQATGTVDYVSSSGTDSTAAGVVLTSTGRDSTGAIQTEVKTLNGFTVQTGTQTYQRLLQVSATGTTAAGDICAMSHTAITSGTAQSAAAQTSTADATITIAAGTGTSCSIGDIVLLTNNTPSGVSGFLRYVTSISTDTLSVNRDWGTVPSSSTTYAIHSGMLCELSPNQVKKVIRPLLELSSNVPGGATITFYSKFFVVNNNTTTTLTNASLTLVSITTSLPGSATLEFALTTALNDALTITNRQTAPTGVTSYTSGAPPQGINVPAPGNLAGGTAPNSANAQGIWLALVLPAGTAPYNGAIDLRTVGQTT